MDLLITGHIPAFELFYRFNYSGEKEWEKARRFPNTGIAIQHVRFNNELVGNAWAIIPYLSFPLARSRYADLQFRVGTGLGYVTRKFDILENRKNTIISTNFNSAINFLLQYHFKPFAGMEVLAGISMTHFSNAAYEVPNAGVNVVGANIGLTFNLGRPVAVNHNSFPILEKKWRYLVWSGVWAKEIDPVNRSKYGAFNISFNALKRFSIKGSYGAGIELMYDRSLKARKPEMNFSARTGAVLCYEIHAGKMSIVLQQGFYLIDQFKSDTFIYERIGWRYRFRKDMVINLTLKSHFARADYAELGIGYFIR